MSDSSYPTYQRYGTNAQRLAFVPNPVSGVQPIYVWYETDTNNIYVYTTGWHGPINSSGTVTHTGNLDANKVIYGNGTADVKAVAFTDGQIPIGKTSDGTASPATLTAGSNITITNAPNSITIASTGGGGGGGLVWIATQIASSSTNLSFTLSSTYDDYLFEISGILTSFNGSLLQAQIGTGGGPTYDTGNRYYTAGWSVLATGTTAALAGGNPSNQWNLSASSGASNNAFRLVSGWIKLHDVNNAGNVGKYMTGQISYFENGGNYNILTLGGGYDNSSVLAAWTAVRFQFASGTIVSGTIRQYGFVK